MYLFLQTLKLFLWNKGHWSIPVEPLIIQTKSFNFQIRYWCNKSVGAVNCNSTRGLSPTVYELSIFNSRELDRLDDPRFAVGHSSLGRVRHSVRYEWGRFNHIVDVDHSNEQFHWKGDQRGLRYLGQWATRYMVGRSAIAPCVDDQLWSESKLTAARAAPTETTSSRPGPKAGFGKTFLVLMTH